MKDKPWSRVENTGKLLLLTTKKGTTSKGAGSPLSLSSIACQFCGYTGDNNNKDVPAVPILLLWPQFFPDKIKSDLDECDVPNPKHDDKNLKLFLTQY